MTATTKGIRAVGYIRVSMARDEMHAPEMYAQQVRDYAKRTKLRVGRVFGDIDMSGRRGSRTRPEFEAMLASAAAGEFDVLIVPKLSRFGRSAKDNLIAFDKLEAAGVRMVFLDLDMDTSTAFGRLMRTLLSAMAEFESDRISDYWREAYRFNVRAGRPHPKAPYGYRYDETKKTYRVVASEARIVRDIFGRYVLGGEPTHSIARAYPQMQKSSIIDMLDNPVYTGRRLLDGEMHEGNWTPLIDVPTFDAAQARRSAAKARSSNREGTGRAMLTGLLQCGVCGRPMSRSGVVYVCPKRKPIGDCSGGGIRRDKIERQVTAAFIERVGMEYAAHAKRKGGAALKGSEGLTMGNDLDAELRRIDAKIARAAAAALDAPGSGFADAFRDQAARLEAQRQDVAEQIAHRDVASLDSDGRREAFAALLNMVTDLEGIFADATDDERRMMLGTVIENVRVELDTGAGSGQRKRIEIDWRS
jgi:DNA invertase Pin-like site-specific DNA recombinase